MKLGKPSEVNKENPDKFYRDLEIDIVARTIWGEAKNHDVTIKKAIANVLQNRVAVAEAKGGYWWGNNLIQVCQKPYQFSCWNRSDPKFVVLRDITKEDYVFGYCVRLAEDVVMGRLSDSTAGATHYHRHSVYPFWAKNETPCAIYQPFSFYRLT